MIIEILLLLNVMILTSVIIVIFFKLKPIIKKMENMNINTLLNNLLPAFTTDEGDTPMKGVEQTSKKREVLQNLVKEGKANLIPGLEALNFEKASEKTINHFYNLIVDPTYVTNRFASYALGVDDVKIMLNDINTHPLMEKSCSSLLSRYGGGVRSPMEGIGVYAYENYSMVLTPLLFLSQVFIHLDWKRFALIAEQRQMLKNQQEKKSQDNIIPKINNDRGESSQTFDETK